VNFTRRPFSFVAKVPDGVIPNARVFTSGRRNLAWTDPAAWNNR
jgi:hypothetical protein